MRKIQFIQVEFIGNKQGFQKHGRKTDNNHPDRTDGFLKGNHSYHPISSTVWGLFGKTPTILPEFILIILSANRAIFSLWVTIIMV